MSNHIQLQHVQGASAGINEYVVLRVRTYLLAQRCVPINLFECVHHRVYMSMDMYLHAHVRADMRDRSGSLSLTNEQGHELKHFFEFREVSTLVRISNWRWLELVLVSQAWRGCVRACPRKTVRVETHQVLCYYQSERSFLDRQTKIQQATRH